MHFPPTPLAPTPLYGPSSTAHHEEHPAASPAAPLGQMYASPFAPYVPPPVDPMSQMSFWVARYCHLQQQAVPYRHHLLEALNNNNGSRPMSPSPASSFPYSLSMPLTTASIEAALPPAHVPPAHVPPAAAPTRLYMRCEDCGKDFLETGLATHRRRQHRLLQEPRTCCDMFFDTWWHYKEHRRVAHKSTSG